MDTIYIGIDFSLNSPGICILNNKRYTWLSYPKVAKTKADQLSQQNVQNLNDVKLKFQQQKDTEQDYSKNEYLKLCHYKKMAQDIFIFITSQTGYPNNFQVGFEGYSYGSRTNNRIDLVTATTLLKDAFIEADIDSINIFAPQTIKKNAGYGKYNKLDMFNVFVDNRLKDPLLKKSSLWQYCKDLNIGSRVPKPLDDLVDSYFIVRSLVMSNS